MDFLKQINQNADNIVLDEMFDRRFSIDLSEGLFSSLRPKLKVEHVYIENRAGKQIVGVLRPDHKTIMLPATPDHPEETVLKVVKPNGLKNRGGKWYVSLYDLREISNISKKVA